MPILIAALILIAFILIFLVGPAYVSYRVIFARADLSKLRTGKAEDEFFKTHEKEFKTGLLFMKHLPSQEVSISSKDGLRLCGVYYDTGASKTVIMMHGYRTLPMTNFCTSAEQFAELGYNLLLPYERAHGKSEGNHCTMGILEQDDLILWTEWLKENGCNEAIVYGVSMGGAATAFASDKLDKSFIRTLIIDCAFVSPYDQIVYDSNIRHIPGALITPFIRLFCKIGLGIEIRQFTTDSLKQCDIPAVFIYGSDDTTVLPDRVYTNYDSCNSSKCIFEADKAPHAMSFLSLTDEQVCDIFKFIKENGGNA